MAVLDEERIRNSFEKVRDDMGFLKNELERVKNRLDKQEEERNNIKSQISQILSFINEIKDNMSFFYKISSGNDGVINNHQQSSTIINDKQQSISAIKSDFEALFRGLTDREFSVFMAIYQLEEDLQAPVSYCEVSKILKITEITVRNYVNSMMNRGIPIEKHRQYNRKVSLSIKKDMRDLNLASKLLKIRQSGSASQQTLFQLTLIF